MLVWLNALGVRFLYEIMINTPDMALEYHQNVLLTSHRQNV